MQGISKGKTERTLEKQEGRKKYQFNDQVQNISEILLLVYFFSLFLKPFSAEIIVSVEVYVMTTLSVLGFGREERRNGFFLLFVKEKNQNWKLKSRLLLSFSDTEP